MFAALNPTSKATRKIPGGEGGKREALERDGGGRTMPGLGRKGETEHGGGGVGSTEEEEEPYCEGNLRIVEVLNGSEGDGDVMCVQYSPDGKLLAAGYSSGIIKVIQVRGGKGLTCWQHHVSIARQSRCLWLCSFLALHVGQLSDRPSRRTSEPGKRLRWPLVQTPISLPQWGADPQINLYDAQTKKRLRTFDATDSRDVMDGHRCRVYAVQFHPTESHVFLTGGWDNTVQFWDDREAHSVRKIFGPHICGDALDIDRLYGHILTGSWRKEEALQIWDFGSGDKIKDIPQDPMHSCQFYCAQWLGREDITCAGSSQNMTRVINRGTLDTIGTVVDLPKGVYCLDNNHLEPNPQLAAGAGSRIYIVQTGVLMSSDK